MHRCVYFYIDWFQWIGSMFVTSPWSHVVWGKATRWCAWRSVFPAPWMQWIPLVPATIAKKAPNKNGDPLWNWICQIIADITWYPLLHDHFCDWASVWCNVVGMLSSCCTRTNLLMSMVSWCVWSSFCCAFAMCKAQCLCLRVEQNGSIGAEHAPGTCFGDCELGRELGW